MDFLNKLGKKFSATYDATTEKTTKLAKEAKLRMKINENKSDIKELYTQIGKKVYEKHVLEQNIDIKTELEEECTKIDVLAAEIETCLKTILELKDKKQCAKCHSEIEMKAVFCPVCGEKQQEDEAKEVEIVKTEKQNNEIEQNNLSQEEKNTVDVIEKEAIVYDKEDDNKNNQ